MNKIMLESLRRVMLRRIVENLEEIDVKDSAGNIVISKDLKVVDKDNFEYTVAEVIEDESGIKIVLRAPTEPRFEDEPLAVGISDDLTEPETPISVPEKDFEEEFEVR